MPDKATPGDADPAPAISVPTRLRQFLREGGDLLTPEVKPERRPDDPDEAQHVRSYLYMRLFIGVLAVTLPFMLVLFDPLLGGDWPRDSLSAYYYSGVREVFVGVLSAIGVFLIAYKLTEGSWDNWLSWLAGLLVLLVAVFPTGLPDNVDTLTPLQEWLTPTWVQRIHFGAAGLFIFSLAVISYRFGVEEGRRTAEPGKHPPETAQPGKHPPEVWRLYHWGCAIVILGVLAAILLDMLTEWGPSRTVLIGEWLAVSAFGASWLVKGAEWDYLRRTKPRPRVEKANDPA